MRNVNIIVGALTVLLVLLLTAIPSRRSRDSLNYSPANEVTRAGTVEDVQEFQCPVTDERGMHVLLNTDQGKVLVHVATALFMRDHKITLQPGDRLQVTGAKIRYQGKEGMIARQIIRRDEVFTVRDTAGKPMWSN